MAAPRKEVATAHSKLPPARTPEARENQLVSLAMDLVERRILDGTASAQETTHFLKLGTTREQLEREKIRHEIEFMQAKSEQIKSQESQAQLAADALAAMKRYVGGGDEVDLVD